MAEDIQVLKDRIVELAVSLYGSQPRPCSDEIGQTVDRLVAAEERRKRPRLMTPEERVKFRRHSRPSRSSQWSRPRLQPA